MTRSNPTGKIRIIPAPQNEVQALELYQRIRSVLAGRVDEVHLVTSPTGSVSEVTDRLRLAAETERGSQVLEDAAMIVQTSGSTSGAPSLVALSADALTSGAEATYLTLGGAGTWVVALPLQHIAGLQMLVRQAVTGGAPLFPEGWPSFSPTTFAGAIDSARNAQAESSKPSFLYASLVSAQLDAILRSGPSVTEAVSRLDALLLGGGRISQTLLARAEAAGIRVYTTYGMTETSGGCVYNGLPLPNTQLRIEAETDRVLISTSSMMNGYLDEPTNWVELDSKRYFRTSDIGHLTEDGLLQIDGRADEIIKSGGIKVSASQVSEIISDSPAVASAFCMGVPDEVWGHCLAALVVLEPNTAKSLPQVAEEIRERVRGTLGSHHAPRIIALTDRLPLTDIGKVSRTSARAIIDEAIRSKTAWQR